MWFDSIPRLAWDVSVLPNSLETLTDIDRRGSEDCCDIEAFEPQLAFDIGLQSGEQLINELNYLLFCRLVHGKNGEMEMGLLMGNASAGTIRNTPPSEDLRYLKSSATEQFGLLGYEFQKRLWFLEKADPFFMPKVRRDSQMDAVLPFNQYTTEVPWQAYEVLLRAQEASNCCLEADTVILTNEGHEVCNHLNLESFSRCGIFIQTTEKRRSSQKAKAESKWQGSITSKDTSVRQFMRYLRKSWREGRHQANLLVENEETARRLCLVVAANGGNRSTSKASSEL
nr:FACT complex subunit SPT16-like [Ipomoea batatas]